VTDNLSTEYLTDQSLGEVDHSLSLLLQHLRFLTPFIFWFRFCSFVDFEQSLSSSKIRGEERKTSKRASMIVRTTCERRCLEPLVARACFAFFPHGFRGKERLLAFVAWEWKPTNLKSLWQTYSALALFVRICGHSSRLNFQSLFFNNCCVNPDYGCE